ncbi:MAG: lysophospholipid acyltransferase family protein [Planctomycetota bacterium]
MGPFQVALYVFCRGTCNLIFQLIYRRIILHKDRIPTVGPVLLVANHQSHFDPPAIGGCMDRRSCSFLARESLFHNPLFGWLIRSLNSVPVKGTAADTGSMKVILQRLESGSPVLIFPEGSRTFDGAMQPFLRGASLLIKRSGCATIPVAIDGAFDAFPRTAKFPRLFGQRIAVSYGTPISAEELLADGPNAAIDRLALEVDALRMECRAALRERTGGRIPAEGPGDARIDLEALKAD